MKTQPHILRRALAAVVDYILVGGLVWVYLLYFGKPDGNGEYTIEGCGALVVPFSIWLIFVPLVEGIAGYTLGKGLLGLQVVDLRGRRVSLWAALLRHSLDPIEMGVVAALVAMLTPTHQRLGDLLAKTRVISDKEAELWSTVTSPAVTVEPSRQGGIGGFQND
jgi:uncharacterized RDD family membrane protein YckC